MAVNQNGPLVDVNINPGYDGRTSGTVSSILGARDETKSAATMQSRNLAETHKAMEDLIKTMNDSIKDLNASFKNTKGFKDFEKQLKNYEQIFSDTSAIINRGSTDIATLAKTVEKANNAYDDMNVAFTEMTTLNEQNVKDLKELNAEKRNELELNRQDLKVRKDIRAEQRKQIIEGAREGSKSLGKAVSNMAKDLADGLSNVKNALSLDSINEKLASGATRSTFAQVQLQTMNAMNLSRNEFNAFKRDLYDQIDTSIYSNTEIRDALATLSDLGINSTTEAVNKMNVIIQGQKLLGMNAEQQAKLQEYSNRTGRDSLTFQTNRMAKWMQMSTNIGQKQLSQLVDLNTNMLLQFADIGVTSKEFENSNTAATAALTSLTGSDAYANYYTEMLTNLASSTDLAAPALGMTSGDVKSRLSAGKTGFDLIYDSNGTFNKLYNLFMNDFAGTVANLDHYIEGFEGMTSQAAALIKQTAEYDKKYGRGAMGRYASSFDVASTESQARAELEKNMSAATGVIAKWVNKTGNWITKIADWTDMSNIESSLTIIIGLLTTIASAEIFQGIGSLFKGLFKGSTVAAAGKGVKTLGSGIANWVTAGKVGTALTKTSAKAAGKAIGKVAAPLTFLEMGIDGFLGYNNTSKEMYGADATTGQKWGAALATSVSSSKVHTDKDGNVSVSKNGWMGAGSGALKGAAIGTLFGPGIGTAIGAAAGALIGGIGGWFKGSKAKEQEQREKDQLAATKDIAENTSKANALLNSNIKITEADRHISSVRSYTGPGGAGPTYSPSAITKSSSGMGAGASGKTVVKSYPWRVSSPFGNRRLSNGDTSFHNGIDFAIGEGTPIGAPVNGTIESTQYDLRNTYPNGPKGAGTWIYLNGADGVTYSFGHLSALGVKAGDTVTAGQTIGLSGNTGYSTGPHLHFGATIGSGPVNPDPDYITNGLFSADGKMMTVTYSNASSSSTSDGVPSSVANPGTQGVFTTRLRALNAPGNGMGAGIISGLSEIKQTLIDLSERQTRDEQILSMLQGTKKQDPRTV